MSEQDVPARAQAPDGRWEREVLEKLVLGTLQEKRRARRWGIFFKLLAFAWLAAALLMAGGWLVREAKVATGRHTALVELNGVIAAGGEASAEDIVTSLRAAFDDTKTVGVVLRINSPGGSPVQAGIIHDEIRRLRSLHPDTPLYAVVEEVCASGGYYVAAAADRIYVDKASLVGSIGVLMEGFGFVGAMEKLGIERRLLTAGTNKGFLDSFSPLPEDQRRHAQQMLDEIHKQFIDVVRAGRGSRLKDSPDLFSGLVWTGAHSVEMGLADGMGTVDSVARDVIKAEDVVDFSTRKNLAERLARRLGATAGETMARALGIAVQTPVLR
ncbi:MAG: S49 family peptidase [Burkholderiaceae bacterium]|nr:S49 family peptidase [Burkholderiaceae bacterium]